MTHHRTLTARAIAPLLLAVLALTGCPKDPKEHRVAVLFTTDEHSHVFPVAPEVDDWPMATTAGTGALKGGMARRATLIGQQRAAMADTVVLSSGDSTQGTLAAVPFTAANFDMQLMKAMGYDAVAIGNHEFDMTSVGLAMAVTAASANGGIGSPQLVLTNVKFSAASAADDSLAALYGVGKAIAPSHVITTPGGLKVGVVASMGLSAAADCAPFAAPITFTDGLPTSSVNALAAVAAQIQPVVDALRNDAKVDVVVLLSHGGVGDGQVGKEDEALAARLTGLDLVLGGHSHAPAQPVRYVNDPSGHKVAVLQTSAYGKELGRAELVWLEGDRPRLDTDPLKTRYLPVDDRIVPAPPAAVTSLIGALVGSLEVGSTPSFLTSTLAAVTGAVHTSTGLGSLYFFPLGHTAFPIEGQGTGESNMLNLDTDAMLAAANAYGGTGGTAAPTLVALQARGSMRANIEPGKNGTLSFADLYRVAPLGLDPIALTPGYPLLRFILMPAQLRAAIEGTLLKSLENPDYFVSPSGLKVVYDRTRPMWNQTATGAGWITSMSLVDDGGGETWLYDVNRAGTYAGFRYNPASMTEPANFIPVTATYQLGAFAASLGITPINPATGAPETNISALIIRYPCAGSGACPSVKDHQALASYVYAESLGNGGTLPSRYDAANVTSDPATTGAIPRRMLCQGADCPAR